MKCPGQDSRFWREDAIFEVKCPKCGNEVEFFKDDTMRKCPNCGHKFLNPHMDFGCAVYCPYAEQCLGSLPAELVAQREGMLKDKVAIEMKKTFGKDFKRIGHAMRVARYAEKIAKKENGDLPVVLISAYLHDIGIVEAERKYNSSAPKYQEQEGPPIAKRILEKLGANERLIKEVCDIIGHHHHPKKEETLNFKCLYDADLLVNLEEVVKKKKPDKKKLKKVIEKRFFTNTGKELAKEILLK